MAEQDGKSAAMVKTGDQSSIGAGCAPGEERDSAIGICAVHSPTVTAAIAEFCDDSVEKQKALTFVLDGCHSAYVSSPFRAHEPLQR